VVVFDSRSNLLAFGFPEDCNFQQKFLEEDVEEGRILTACLKKSLLVYAAVPAISFPDFERRVATVSTVNGSGMRIASVSVTASIPIA